MSVSASVVRIRYCDAMQQQVVVSALEHPSCCCADDHAMAMQPETKTSTEQVALTPAPKSCCSEILLQSRLTTNQLLSSDTYKIQDQAPQWAAATIFTPSAFQPALFSLPEPVAIAVQARPPTIPLYKLFQRFTYYG